MSHLNHLIDDAITVLTTAGAAEKANASLRAAQRWQQKSYEDERTMAHTPPDQPARPARPELLPPRDMPRRKPKSEVGKRALVHAIAHIELNAIDLAWDMIARFGSFATLELGLPEAFLDDWVRVGREEAEHCLMLLGRLTELECSYGDFPAHDGLWEAAYETRHDILARLAVVPMNLEARGLDVNPAMAQKLEKHGDLETAQILGIIYEEEIGHVKIGTKWFQAACLKLGQDPVETFQDKLNIHFKGHLKPPFNSLARDLAGLSEAYYLPLAAKN